MSSPLNMFRSAAKFYCFSSAPFTPRNPSESVMGSSITQFGDGKAAHPQTGHVHRHTRMERESTRCCWMWWHLGSSCKWDMQDHACLGDIMQMGQQRSFGPFPSRHVSGEMAAFLRLEKFSPLNLSI
ncbi:hypothetical protein CEXT_42811 [Caerostris extrusa]|uniref:Uncharacterized protein n=1 Tax=Caerostris extrusa TaxID=172846 RepID=A0AAV4TXM9_CAEEX|nr:hypothetical protein CEXT_42811 [Caerostris extrusa]